MQFLIWLQQGFGWNAIKLTWRKDGMEMRDSSSIVPFIFEPSVPFGGSSVHSFVSFFVVQVIFNPSNWETKGSNAIQW